MYTAQHIQCKKERKRQRMNNTVPSLINVSQGLEENPLFHHEFLLTLMYPTFSCIDLVHMIAEKW